MKKTMLFALCIASAALLLTGCFVVNFTGQGSNAGPAVQGTGAREGYQINVGAYSSVRIEGQCDLRYYSAPSGSVTLEIQPNLREYYEAEVINGVLVVSTTRSINTSSIPILSISVPELNGISISGACEFTAIDKITSDSFNVRIAGAGTINAELDTNSLEVNISGAGNVNLSGRADAADISMSGAGDVSAMMLQTRDSTVRISGAGSVRISVSDNLKIDASGMGTIEYSGSPNIDQRTSGLVSIRKAG